VPHSQAKALIAACEAVLAKYKAQMDANRITVSRLNIAIDTHSYSFEPVLHWYDSWLPVHSRIPEASYLAKIKDPGPNPQATALVEEIRGDLCKVFADFGASSNQIGKTYPYWDNLDANTRGLLKAIKKHVDPDGQFNPGVLGMK